MKIYLATTAPGNEGREKMLNIPNRLLSYYHIVDNAFSCRDILRHIQRGWRKNK